MRKLGNLLRAPVTPPAAGAGKGGQRSDCEPSLVEARRMVEQEMMETEAQQKNLMEEGAQWAKEIDEEEKKRKQEAEREVQLNVATTKAKGMPPPPPPP